MALESKLHSQKTQENKNKASVKPDEVLVAKNKYSETLSKTAKKTKRKLKQAKNKLDKTVKKTIELYKKAEKYIKNPKKRKELIEALGIDVVIDLYGDYKEKFDKEMERKRDEKESKKDKNLEKYDFEEPRDAKTGEVMLACQIMCVNTHAIAYNLDRVNKKTGKKYKYTNPLGKELKKLGIVPNILKGSTSLFKDGVGNFASFKERIKILDTDNNLDNATEILMRSAIGKYQIIPRHHFSNVKGWDEKGNEFKLKMMFLFLRNESLQNGRARRIIEAKNRRYKGEPYIMAASYYAGGRGARIMKKYIDAVKRGEITDTSSLEKKQAYGYGSIMEYAELVVQYQKGYKRKYPDKSFTETFQMAIAKQESGYLRNKRVKV